MSMGSIGSLRGALGSVETQPSLTTLSVYARDRAAAAPTDAPEGAGAIQAGGSNGFAPGVAPWAPWPPYMPPPPEQPVASKPVVSPLPLPPVEEGPGGDLTVRFMPPPEQPEASKPEVSSIPVPQPPGVEGSGGGPKVEFLPTPPREPVAGGGLVVSPLPLPPDGPVVGSRPVVEFMPLPPDMPIPTPQPPVVQFMPPPQRAR